MSRLIFFILAIFYVTSVWPEEMDENYVMEERAALEESVEADFANEIEKGPGSQNTIVLYSIPWKLLRLPLTFLNKTYFFYTKKTHAGYLKDFNKLSHIEKTEVAETKKEVFAYNSNYKNHHQVWSFNLSQRNSMNGVSCKEACPNSMELLAPLKDRMSINKDWSLSFKNVKEDFNDSYKKTIGYCWGMSASLAIIKHFAFFDAKNELGETVPDKETHKVQWYKFYKKKINQLFREQPVVFPGYASMRELANEPELKQYLKVKVAYRWALYGVSLKSFVNLFGDVYPNTPKQWKAFIREAKQRLYMNQIPRMMFNAERVFAYSHVANVVGIKEMTDGSTRIYIQDPNFLPEDVPNEGHYITVSKEGVATYAPFINTRAKKELLGKVTLTQEGRVFEANSIRSLRRFCIEYSGCDK